MTKCEDTQEQEITNVNEMEGKTGGIKEQKRQDEEVDAYYDLEGWEEAEDDDDDDEDEDEEELK